MKTTVSTIMALGLFLAVNIIGYAQVSSQPLSLDTSPIEDQFQYVYQKSSDFEEYKMVKRWYLTRLKSHVMDSLKEKQDQLIQARSQITLKESMIDSLQTVINTTTSNLNTVIKEKDSFAWLGIPMQKAGYNSMVWSIIAVLTFSLLIFILLYRRSYRVIVNSETDLNETRSEFEAFRKRALEREEGIVRKYHNELMKYKSRVSKV